MSDTQTSNPDGAKALYDVSIPAGPVTPNPPNMSDPTVALLRDLYLLGTAKEMDEVGNFTKALTGPPQSIALIESSATAVAKWWAAGGAALVAAAWGWVSTHWSQLDRANEPPVIWALGIASAALILAIGYLLASDIRARASAARATIEARAKIAERMIIASTLAAHDAFVPLTAPIKVHNIGVDARDERDWTAFAVRRGPGGQATDGDLSFLLHKDHRWLWVPQSQISD